MEFRLTPPSNPLKTMATGCVTPDKSQVVLRFLHHMPFIILAQVPEEILSMVNSLLMIPQQPLVLLGLRVQELTLLLNLMLPNATPTTLNISCYLSDSQPEMAQLKVSELTPSTLEEDLRSVEVAQDLNLLTPEAQAISPGNATNLHPLRYVVRPNIKLPSGLYPRVKPFLRYLATGLVLVPMSALQTLRRRVWLILASWL
uniref:NS7 protein n=1 Tax=Porcine deltacoronavirus TaxID=1586324 RepID=A0A6M9Z7X4_9NIDO|nr:NS7 protein [Porcine deltacoronavirus]WGD01580.1 non-structural protein 7 [Porcine deltacoronavirus]